MEIYAIISIILISIAGPVIGSLIGIIKKPSDMIMYNFLAFAGGAMLAISFLELIPESIGLASTAVCSIGLILGAVVMFGLDKLIPHIHPELGRQEQGCRLKRTAVYLLIGIFLHNFPEGLAMGIGSVTGFKLSLVIALAIAIHDIPEGICTSAPYFAATGKRMKAFLLSSATAIPTIIGFLISYYLFQYIPLSVVGLIVAATAGLMIYISGDELIPTSCNKYCRNWSHSTIFSLIAGVLMVILLGTIHV
jgi:ZIP family zinc transporter